MGRNWRDTIEKVRVADSLGYSMVTSGEAWGPSMLPSLTLLATHTENIHIGTSILNVFSRSPGAIAQEFATLEMLSGGRMVIGLGSSGHRVIEHFHGIPFNKPLRRIREYVEIIKLLLSGKELNYEGEIFQMSRGFRLDYAQQRTDVPIYIAAITPKSITQTGEIADGIFPIHWPSDQFGSLKQDLRLAADTMLSSKPDIEVAPFTNVYITESEPDESVWDQGRQPLFHYINRMGDFYWNMLASNGYEEEVHASRNAWKSRDREGAMAAISKRMVADIQVIGTRDEAREQLKRRFSSGADVQLIPLPSGTLSEVTEELEFYLG